MSAIAKTASITLITAVPGSGKSLRAVWYAKEAIENGETVFYANVNGMAVPGAIEFPDPTRWQELPAGAVLIVDEAQKFFRAGIGAGANLPSFIAEMETIRHMGIRLILLTQHPALIHANIRALVGFHEHLVREDGKESAKVYTRSRVIDNVRSDKALASEDHHTWQFPKDCYALYKSAEVHTFKRTIKFKYKRAAVLLLIAAAIGGGSWWQLYRQTDKPEASTQTAAHAASQPRSSGRRADEDKARWKTATQYADDHRPRFGTMPWTAPVFDGRAASADPQLYCMSSSGGDDVDGNYREPSCVCLTEQGTKYEVGDGECRRVARHGMPYNPYRERREMQPAPAIPADPQPVPGHVSRNVTVAPDIAAGAVGRPAAYGEMRAAKW